MKPTDENTTLVIDGRKYYYCKHCVCKHTKVKELFNTTHSSNDHTFSGTNNKSDGDTVMTKTSTTTSSVSTLALVLLHQDDD